MICFTTFIFTLLLAHIARAVGPVPQAACGYAYPVSPQKQYYTTHDKGEQLVPPTYPVTVNSTFDNVMGDPAKLECRAGPYGPLKLSYSTFGNPPSYFPNFPYIGGEGGVKYGTKSCGRCWRLSLPGGGRFIYMLAVDTSQGHLSIGQHAYNDLIGAPSNPPNPLQVEALAVPPYLCGLPSSTTGK